MYKWPTRWDELPVGGVIDKPGNSIYILTGSWRSSKPVVDLSKCIKCLICWVDCPDNSIIRLDNDYVDIDYDHCKGCGICAQVCPTNAIEMVEEES